MSLEVIDGFTKTDEKLWQKFFNEKIEQGFKQVKIFGVSQMDEAKAFVSPDKKD